MGAPRLNLHAFVLIGIVLGFVTVALGAAPANGGAARPAGAAAPAGGAAAAPAGGAAPAAKAAQKDSAGHEADHAQSQNHDHGHGHGDAPDQGSPVVVTKGGGNGGPQVTVKMGVEVNAPPGGGGPTPHPHLNKYFGAWKDLIHDWGLLARGLTLIDDGRAKAQAISASYEEFQQAVADCGHFGTQAMSETANEFALASKLHEEVAMFIMQVIFKPMDLFNVWWALSYGGPEERQPLADSLNQIAGESEVLAQLEQKISSSGLQPDAKVQEKIEALANAIRDVKPWVFEVKAYVEEAEQKIVQREARDDPDPPKSLPQGVSRFANEELDIYAKLKAAVLGGEAPGQNASSFLRTAVMPLAAYSLAAVRQRVSNANSTGVAANSTRAGGGAAGGTPIVVSGDGQVKVNMEVGVSMGSAGAPAKGSPAQKNPLVEQLFKEWNELVHDWILIGDALTVVEEGTKADQALANSYMNLMSAVQSSSKLKAAEAAGETALANKVQNEISDFMLTSAVSPFQAFNAWVVAEAAEDSKALAAAFHQLESEDEALVKLDQIMMTNDLHPDATVKAAMGAFEDAVRQLHAWIKKAQAAMTKTEKKLEEERKAPDPDPPKTFGEQVSRMAAQDRKLYDKLKAEVPGATDDYDAPSAASALLALAASPPEAAAAGSARRHARLKRRAAGEAKAAGKRRHQRRLAALTAEEP